jgi:hypothetical protein
VLTGGEAHDCPVAERLIRRVTPPKRMLGDKAYDSAELHEELDERGATPLRRSLYFVCAAQATQPASLPTAAATRPARTSRREPRQAG